MTDNSNYNSNFHDALNKPANGDNTPHGPGMVPPANPFSSGLQAPPANQQSPYSMPNAPYGGAPQPGYGGATRTNQAAIISAVAAGVSLISIFFLQILSIAASIAGIIFGHKALKQIRATGEQGRGLALTGLITNYVLIAVSLLIILFFIFVIGMFAFSASSM